MPRTSHEMRLRRDLRSVGLRSTGPRLAVLDLLRRSRRPLSHGEVVGRLRPGGWNRATLYRNLMDLARSGLARRIDLGDRIWRFEAAGGERPHRHPHFLCRHCGSVVCLTDVTVRVQQGRAAPVALRGQELEVLFKGCCDRCREDDA
jgi:Fur family transcriptional regulator, ferric uptake regulator